MFRVWLNRLWFGIHNKILNFHDWTLCCNKLFHDNRGNWKSMGLYMDLWLSNNMKVNLPNFAKDNYFWTLWTLNYVDCIPFSCIGYFEILFSNFQKTWLNLQLCDRNPMQSVLLICPSACLSACLSVCLSVCLSAFSSGCTLWVF